GGAGRRTGRMRRRTSPRIATLLLAGGLVAAPAAAQLPSLDRAEELIARGEYAAAREIVERWWREEPAASPDILRAGRPRALLLRARLAAHAAEAERDYVAVALGHPSSPERSEEHTSELQSRENL